MVSGSCLCGKVRIEIEGGLELQPQACHCTQCRKQTGHFLAAVNVRREALTIHGSENVKWFRSSEQVRRGFCRKCGSTLFWDAQLEGYEYMAIAMGLIDGPSETKLSRHTFVNDKGDYYDLDDGVPQSESF